MSILKRLTASLRASTREEAEVSLSNPLDRALMLESMAIITRCAVMSPPSRSISAALARVYAREATSAAHARARAVSKEQARANGVITKSLHAARF